MAGDATKLLRSPILWLKVFELLLIFLMIGLVTNGFVILGGNTDGMSRAFIMLGTPYAYLIINVIIIIGFFMNEAISKKLTIIQLVIGGVLFVTSGALLIQNWISFNLINDYSLGGGIVGIILGAIYLVDAAFTFKFD